MNESKSSFTIGTPSSGGQVKVYWDKEDEAEKKIERAIQLYIFFVERRNIRKEMR